MKAIIPDSTIMHYMLAIGVASFVVSYIDWRLLKTNKFSNKIFWLASSIFSQVGTGVLSVLRIGTGMFFCLGYGFITNPILFSLEMLCSWRDTELLCL